MGNKNVCPENAFGHKFRMIHNSVEKCVENHKRKMGDHLTAVQEFTIHYLVLHRQEDIFQKDIEAAFSISGATASNILKGMEKKGLIQRIPVAYDARLKKIVLTSQVVEYERKMSIGIQHMESVITRGMTEEEIEMFSQLLDRALNNIENEIRLEEQ